jgi:hypothetical protein
MIERIADTNKLPQELLANCKAFLRVDHCEEDITILMLLGAVIDQFEHSGTIIHPSEITWTVEDDFIDGEMEVAPGMRITPISEWTATIPAEDELDPPVDVTADYSLRTVGLAGIRFYSLVGSAQDGLELAITAGYASADLMPFKTVADIFQAVSKLYTYRDVLTPTNLQELPDWANRVLAAHWVPSV